MANANETGREHRFVETFFTSPTYCQFCTKFIWGVVTKQGHECSECGFTAHKKCVATGNIPNNCGAQFRGLLTATAQVGNGTAHAFELHHFNSPRNCAVCDGFIWGLGKQGYKCSVCKFPSHKKCLFRVPNTCLKRDQTIEKKLSSADLNLDRKQASFRAKHMEREAREALGKLERQNSLSDSAGHASKTGSKPKKPSPQGTCHKCGQMGDVRHCIRCKELFCANCYLKFKSKSDGYLKPVPGCAECGPHMKEFFKANPKQPTEKSNSSQLLHQSAIFRLFLGECVLTESDSLQQLATTCSHSTPPIEATSLLTSFAYPPASLGPPPPPPTLAGSTELADSSETENLCVICWEQPINSVLLECAHRCICTDCGDGLKECPMCRKKISRVVRIYDA